MKLISILALYALSVMVNGAWWIAAVQPVILSMGAVFAALDLDLQPMLDLQPSDFNFKKLLIFKNEEEEEKNKKE